MAKNLAFIQFIVLAAMLLRRAVRLSLCPKALLSNISEYAPVNALFTLGKAEGWSGEQLAASFLVARGVRGREGVQVVFNFCKADPPMWGDDKYVDRFIEAFEAKWKEEVLKTRKVSALSHQEHHHAGLSGMNFVETLKNKDNRFLCFAKDGMAARLAPYFGQPQLLDADVLLRFYQDLVKKPLHMAPNTYAVQIEGARILGKKHKKDNGDDDFGEKKDTTVAEGSYNSMDFLRCFSNIMTDVFKSPEVLFTKELWMKMLSCQSHPKETRELLQYFNMDMDKANDFITATPGMNWTTFLVCLCEIRQAMGDTPQSKDSFVRLVQMLEDRPDLHLHAAFVSDWIVSEGAVSKECYAVRVCKEVQAWFEDTGSASFSMVAENGIMTLAD